MIIEVIITLLLQFLLFFIQIINSINCIYFIFFGNLSLRICSLIIFNFNIFNMLKHFNKVDYLLPFIDMSKNESNILIFYTLITTMYENAFSIASLFFLQFVIVKIFLRRYQKNKEILVHQVSIDEIYKGEELEDSGDESYGHFVEFGV